jgi:hypothetical protein
MPQKRRRMPRLQRNKPITPCLISFLSPTTPILRTPIKALLPLPQEIIKGEQGNVIWDPQQYSFIKEGDKAPDSVNPSLWRQSQLINISGLFEVTDGVYQIRNLDLSNMTIIEGKEGITVVDPLVSAETAKVGMDLYFKNRGKSLSSPLFIPTATLTTMAACAAWWMKPT